MQNMPKNHYDSPLHPFWLELKQLLPKELATVIDYYEILIDILQDKIPKRMTFTDAERARIAVAAVTIKNMCGQSLFAKIKHFVQPDTILRWFRKLKAAHNTYNNTPKKPGRPPLPSDCVSAILKIAHDTGFGYQKIAGELTKLGYSVSSQTVKNILMKNGISPSGTRKKTTWSQFIRSHMDVTWACDYFTETVITIAGPMTCYVLFFIHLGTRRLHIADCTYNPNSQWVAQQARNFSYFIGDNPQQQCKYLIHDNDTSLKMLDSILECDGSKIVKTSLQSPMQNAFAERAVREIREEVLEHLIICGRHHLYHVLKEFEDYHNYFRPHQGIGNKIPLGYKYPKEAAPFNKIECEEILGGLLKHYHVRNAA